MKEFDDFDVSGENFEEFDVTKEPEAKPEISIESLGGMSADENELRSLSQARDEMEERLLIAPAEMALAAAEEGPSGFGNIVGVGIGEKEVGGIPTGQLAVKVFVKEKLYDAEVSAEALVPRDLGGVPTDVDATGEVEAQRFAGRYRPAPCGVSIGNCAMAMAGTLGCLVTRQAKLYILSNNHVMALVNRAPVGAGIPQPGRLDGGVCSRDIIARLAQFVPISFGGTNVVDAAIAQTSPALVDRRVIRLGGMRQRLVAPEATPLLGMPVQKSGRTTQYRRGLIDAVSVTVNVSYAPLGGVARFANQFRVRGIGGIFSDAGDSGSLVTTYPANRPVGLLFAGSAGANMTFCNDIRRVRAQLGVAIVY